MQNPYKKQGLIAVAVDRMRRNQDIEIWGDGLVVRDYIWVGDLTKAIASLLAKGSWDEIYNIGSGVGYSINEVLSTIKSLLSTQSKIVYGPARIEDVKHIVLDIQKLRTAIEFYPLELKQGIKLYIQDLDPV
jgi:UDP-glucose 4-epimerase